MTPKQRLEALPARLKQLRETYGMSQEDMSAHLGVSASVFGHYENGRSFPSYEMLLRICHAFNTSPNWIFNFED